MSVCDLLLLDARYLLYRGAYAFKELVVEIDGEAVYTGAAYGLLRQIIKIQQTHGGIIVMVWDSLRNIRRETLPTYKAHKPLKGPQKELIQAVHEQEPMAIKLLSLLGIRQVEAKGYEADDVMYTLAKHYAEVGHQVGIFTGDEDLLQAVGPGRVVILAKRKEDDIWVDEDKMTELKGLTPDQFGDAKCLAGCAGDNVPGVPGVGETYATRIIQRFGRLGDVLHNLNKPERWEGLKIQKKTRQNIIDHKEQVLANVKLVRLIECRDKVEFFPVVRNIEMATVMMNQLGFKSLLVPPKLDWLVALGAPKENEIICPRGGRRYKAEELAEMCQYHLDSITTPLLGNEYCKSQCDVPGLIGVVATPVEEPASGD